MSEGGGIQSIDPVRSSWITGGREVTDSEEEFLKSIVILTNVMDHYVEHVKTMQRDLKYSSQEDKKWCLKMWNHNDIGVVKIFCIECRKEIEGDNVKHDKASIQNLLDNFKAKHLSITNQDFLFEIRCGLCWPSPICSTKGKIYAPNTKDVPKPNWWENCNYGQSKCVFRFPT